MEIARDVRESSELRGSSISAGIWREVRKYGERIQDEEICEDWWFMFIIHLPSGFLNRDHHPCTGTPISDFLSLVLINVFIHADRSQGI